MFDVPQRREGDWGQGIEICRNQYTRPYGRHVY